MLKKVVSCGSSVKDEQRERVIVPDAGVCAGVTDPTHSMCAADDRRVLHCSDPGPWTQRYHRRDQPGAENKMKY